jgi:hypothetical protein
MIQEANFGVISKEFFEEWLGEEITENTWNKVRDEIEGRVENFVDQLLQDIILDVKEGRFDQGEEN